MIVVAYFCDSGPMRAYVLAREDAICHWRELMGPTKVFRARHTFPTSIRAQFGLTDTRNTTHGSGEISLCIIYVLRLTCQHNQAIITSSQLNTASHMEASQMVINHSVETLNSSRQRNYEHFISLKTNQVGKTHKHGSKLIFIRVLQNTV